MLRFCVFAIWSDNTHTSSEKFGQAWGNPAGSTSRVRNELVVCQGGLGPLQLVHIVFPLLLSVFAIGTGLFVLQTRAFTLFWVTAT